MASIDDIATAARRIESSAKGVAQRTQSCSTELYNHSVKLHAVVKGSRSGEDAAKEVDEAQRAVRDCALALTRLQAELRTFVRDLTK
ncbi:hypothetical protein [Rathayibacter sp. Leaf296]|uniref:hypothetical protein n=1 Tax=Rathayibacter sp. Leaf296 TaxID=1736327 RepID=UPI000703BC4F|nr:hypothetical protein [Rathayibacter sp. Leaf296]KQQ08302.1 hypothetical protein ASF46_13325 [Rathayibacter sp. Leaf296]